MAAELTRQLDERLYDALRPCVQALQAMGLSPQEALRENTVLFAHGVGLLLLQHTGRMRLFRQDVTQHLAACLADLAACLQPGQAPPP